jgi:hypothetical protein
MYKHLFRFLSVLLFVIIICGTVQATNLELTVLDSLNNITISHATVFLNDVNIGMTDNFGQFYISQLSSNDFKLRLSASGYNDWQNTVGGNVTNLTVNMDRKSLTLKLSIYDSDTLSPIPNADITLTTENLTQTKQTDNTGTVTFGVTGVTIYTININSPNYPLRTETIEIGFSNREAQYWLLSSNRFSFIVKDQDGMTPLQDAEVRLDTVLVGKTDSRGILNTQVGRGKTYSIEIRKDGYQPYIETRAITDTDALLNVVMSKIPVGAFVYAVDESQAPVSGAEVYLDGTLVGTTDKYGHYTLSNVVSGSYSVEVRKTGLVNTQESINVTKQGDEFTIVLPFETVGLTVYVQDKEQKFLPNVTILFNNENRGLTDSHGQISTNAKLNTLYNITAIKDGYLTVSVQKEFKQDNMTPTLSLTLEKNLDWGFIGIIIVGALVVILLFGLIRMGGSKRRHHIIRKNEI